LDNPPVFMVTDGVISGGFSDANLFMLRQGYSHKSQVTFIDQLAAKDTMQKVCIVMNDVQSDSYGYGHKNGYSGKGSSYSDDIYGGGYYNDSYKPKGWERIKEIIKNPFRKF